jgi:shikimate dehydrogenase
VITGRTRVFAVAGHPIAHSQSPTLHNAWFAHHGVDGVYVALDVAPDHTGAIVDAMRHLGIAGVNLTIPHKRNIIPMLDALTPAASAVGAVNVVFRDGQRLIGDNTDVGGLARCLTGPSSPQGRSVVVLGAGGAGRAAAAAVAGLGASRVTVLNRTLDAAAAVARDLAPTWPGSAFTADALTPEAFAAAAPALVIVATAGAADEQIATLPLEVVDADGTWCDINYWRSSDRFEPVQRAGIRWMDGRGMLLHQAALAFERFTGISPDCALAAPLLR